VEWSSLGLRCGQPVGSEAVSGSCKVIKSLPLLLLHFHGAGLSLFLEFIDLMANVVYPLSTSCTNQCCILSLLVGQEKLFFKVAKEKYK
jgi:hypothetical protein